MKFVLPYNTIHTFAQSTDGNADTLKIAVYDSGILLTDLATFGGFSYSAWDITDALKNAYIETVDILRPGETYTVVAYALKQIDNLPSMPRAMKISSDELQFQNFRDIVESRTL